MAIGQFIAASDRLGRGMLSEAFIATGYPARKGIDFPYRNGVWLLQCRKLNPPGNWEYCGTLDLTLTAIVNRSGYTLSNSSGYQFRACRANGNGYISEFTGPIRVDIDSGGNAVSPALPAWPIYVISKAVGSGTAAVASDNTIDDADELRSSIWLRTLPVADGSQSDEDTAHLTLRAYVGVPVAQNGKFLIGWTYDRWGEGAAPSDFAIYEGTTPASIDYGTILGTVTYVQGERSYQFTTSVYTGGTPHSFAVRARNTGAVTEGNLFATVARNAETAAPTGVGAIQDVAQEAK